MKRLNNTILFVTMYIVSMLLLIFLYKNTKVDTDESVLQNYMEYVHSVQVVKKTNKDIRVTCIVEAIDEKNEVVHKKVCINKLLMNDFVVEMPFSPYVTIKAIKVKFITARYESKIYIIIEIMNILSFVLIITKLIKYYKNYKKVG